MSICRLPLLIKYFNRHFYKSINMENSIINIHETQMDAFQLKKWFFKPIDACRYCAKYEYFDWEKSGEPKLADYCVGFKESINA